MNAVTWVCLAVAGAAAGVDWWSVVRERRSVEYVAKPLVLVALIAAALVLVPADGGVRVAMVVGLGFGLIGDVFLMLDRFIPGAAAFLVGHIAYLVAFVQVPLTGSWLFGGAVILGLLLSLVARPVITGALGRSSVLGGIVIAYLVALGAVLVLGVGTGNLWAAAGVILFAVSDSLLALGRFAGRAPGGRVMVHVTYHVAQALLVLSLPTLG
ncbi:MAG: lysoplasmalogenase [Candidatus Nanopelagicales bacterium]